MVVVHALDKKRKKWELKSTFEVDGVHANPSLRHGVCALIWKREMKLDFIRKSIFTLDI